MKTALAVAGVPAEFCPLTMAVHVNSIPVEPGTLVELCSWCDTKQIMNQSLYLSGYPVSHGICDACLARESETLLSPQPDHL